MSVGRSTRWLSAVGAVVLLTSCSGGTTPPAKVSGSPVDCRAAVDTVLAEAQGYLDGLAQTQASGLGPESTASPAPVQGKAAQQDFAQAVQDVQAYARARGCDPVDFRRDVASGLEGLRTGGPVAAAVRRQLAAKAAGAPPPTVPLSPGDDVAAALGAAPTGTRVMLTAGTFVLPDTLALLRGVTLVGAGRDLTRLESAAGGGPVLVLTDEPVTLEALTVRRVGTAAGPVLTAGPVSTLTVRSARVSGARSDAQGLGGVGILLSGGANGQIGPARRVSLTVSSSEVVGNAVAGIVVAGEHRASIQNTLVSGSSQCGVCFLGTADGVLDGSRLVGDGAGLVAAGDSRPKLTGSTVRGGEVGIQALDRSAPEIRGVTLTGQRRAAMIWTARARGRIEGNTCTQVDFGIVVGPQALPYVGQNACKVDRGRQ